MPKLLTDILVSRKAQATLLLILTVVWGPNIGLGQDAIDGIQTALVAFVLARAVHDHALAK